MSSVIPGQTKVSTPNTIAQMPRKSSSHQFLASACSSRRGSSGGLATYAMTASLGVAHEH